MVTGPGGQDDDLHLSHETRALLDAIGETTRKTVDILNHPAAAHVAGHLTASMERLTAAATAVLAGAGTKCLLWSPSATIISTIDSRTGNLRLECLHPQPHQHCWELTGTRITC